MRKIGMGLFFVVCICLIGQGQTSTANGGAARSVQIVPLNFSASDQSNMLARTGGMLEKPVEGASVVLINAQKEIDDALVSEWVRRMKAITRLPIKVVSEKDVSKSGVELAKKALTEEKTAAVLVLSQVKGQPTLLLAPEDKWVIVNVSALIPNTKDQKILEERAQKETWRGLCHLMGTANSTFEPCLMKPVFSMDDLDALKARSISPEPMRKISMSANKMGIKPNVITTYRNACEEGWAPIPTNEIQKAIWEEVKVKKTPGKEKK